jgi:hypothetical protein
MDHTGSSRPSVTRGEPDAVKVARPVREGGPGKRTRGNSDTAPGADPHWELGGETALSNLVMLCLVHHREIHSSGWVVRIAGDGLPEFIPPPWIDPQQRPRRNPNPYRPDTG